MNEYLISYRPHRYSCDMKTVSVLGDSKVEALMSLVNMEYVYRVYSVERIKR